MNMNEFYNHIQYVIPENSEVSFSILPETRDISLKVLEGIADIYVKDKIIRLPLQLEFSIQFWECLCPRLKTRVGCNFLVRGNHYAFCSIQPGFVKRNLFGVSANENSYSFVLEKNIQLQIFPVKSTEKKSSVSISISRGAPEISGFKLSRKTTYHLSPFSPVLVESSDEKPYSVYVHGLERKVIVSMQDGNHRKCANDVKDHIIASCLLEKQFKHTNPTILVLGPKHSGKTSFCQLLVNEALEKKLTPICVDLNIKRNLTIPGSLSLSEIENRIDSTLDFKYNIQRLLHYGSVIFTSVTERLYYFLVRKMGGLLSFHLNYNNKENCLSIIDTDGSQGENSTAIEHILKSFAVDLVVYIGNDHFYANLKNSILENVPSKFIPKPVDVLQPSEFYEAKFYQNRIQRYFFGSTDPSNKKARTIAIHQFTIYRISTSPEGTSTSDEKAPDYRVERIDFNLSLLNRLFGVSAAKRVDLHGITEIKYYVYFTDVNMATKTATVIVPESENFNGGILLMGYILKLYDSENN